MREYLKRLKKPQRLELETLLSGFDSLESTDKKGITRYRLPFESVAHLRTDNFAINNDVVTIGLANELDESDHKKVYQVMRNFMPWRKGPFSIFGIEIDAEWRSERKWNRLLPVLPDLKDKTIADIGSNNGYYMFRMA